MDADNLFETGGSYGGFMTNWIIGHTHRFAAAPASGRSPTGSRVDGVSDIGPYFGQDQGGATHLAAMDKAWWHSRMKYADKCTTPTLFIHSDEDYRCWMVEALQMFSALKVHGIEIARLPVPRREPRALPLRQAQAPHPPAQGDHRLVRAAQGLKWKFAKPPCRTSTRCWTSSPPQSATCAKTAMPRNGANEYPDRSIVTYDIACVSSYVMLENGEIVGTFALFLGEDESYRVIEDGVWHLDKPYGNDPPSRLQRESAWRVEGLL